MAKRPSVQEILAAARKGGAAKPRPSRAGAEPRRRRRPTSVEVAEVEATAVEPAAAAPHPRRSAGNVPTPSTLGRPLTLKEKLAAARAGGSGHAAPALAAPRRTGGRAARRGSAGRCRPRSQARRRSAPAKPLGRPMTLQEKLAAARGARRGRTRGRPAPSPPRPSRRPRRPPRRPVPPATLPPLEKITDPRDLAEALRQTGAKKTKEVAAKAAEAAPAKPAAAAKSAPPSRSPCCPSRQDVAAAAAPPGQTDRRGFMIGSLFVSWVVRRLDCIHRGLRGLHRHDGPVHVPQRPGRTSQHHQGR